MSFSPALQYMLDRLEGLSTNHFILQAQNQTSNITPQSIIRFTLPSNALVDMHSFTLHFNCQTSAGAGGSRLRLPKGIESLINRVEVSIGGVAIAAGCNFYNVLCHAKQVVDGAYQDVGLGHPAIIPVSAEDNYVNGAALANAEAPVATNNQAQFAVAKWKGFLGECQPRVVDTSLMGDIVISVFLEQAGLVVSTSAGVTAANFVADGAAGGTYTLNNVYATIRCYSLANGVYDNMIAEQMAQQGNLEIGFKQYFSFRDTTNGTMRFTVASQSLDRLIVAQHGANATTNNQAPSLIPGYNDGITAAAGAGNVSGRLLGFNSSNYVNKYFYFDEDAAPVPPLYQMQLNGANFPMWRGQASDWLRITQLASNTGYVNKDDGLHQYKNGKFVQALKLTLDAPNARFIQGLDTRSVSLNGYWNLYGLANPKVVTLFAECTSSLLVGIGRQIEVIQ